MEDGGESDRGTRRDKSTIRFRTSSEVHEGVS
jgi:hypothetical protein